MSFDLVYVNVRYSPQHNSKVGRKFFDNFRLSQANCDKYFLKKVPRYFSTRCPPLYEYKTFIS